MGVAQVRFPRNPYPGFNVKLTGRVAPLKPIRPITKAASEYNGPIEFAPKKEEGVEKTAANFLGGIASRIPHSARNAFYGTLGTVAAGAIAHGIGWGIESAKGLMANSKYDAALRTAIQMSPTLQRHGYDVLKGYMPMIIKASPTVAEEPRLLANYLESMLDAEGHMNLTTFAELSALEGNVLRNKDMRNSVSNTILNSGIKGITEGVGKAVANDLSRAYTRQSESRTPDPSVGVQGTLF